MTAKTALLAALTLIAVSIAATWYVMRPVPVVETPKPAETQADGSRIVERTATQPKARPKQIIPKGAKVERIESVTVQPTATAEAGKPCPPVTVDMTLVREPDGSKRVIASSPDGAVVAGLDIPVDTLPVPEIHPLAAGVSINPANQTAGLWVERDIGRVRVGLEINQARHSILNPMAAEVRLRAGWTF